MRKVMLAVVLCLLATVVAQAGIPITVVNPGFELPALALEAKIKGFDGDRDGFMGAEFDVPGWQDDCISGSLNHSGIKNEGGQRAITGQGAHLSDLATEIANENIVWQLTDQVIAAGDTYTLSVWGWSDGGSGGIGLEVSLFYDGASGHTELNSAYHLLADDDEVGIACPVTFTIPSGHDSIGSNLGIKFENTTLTGFAHLDDAWLEQVLVSNPDPCDGETGVAVTANLGWELESVVTNCDVYFGSDPNFINNPMVVDGTEGKVESYDLPVLDTEETYYWRVDARIDATVYEGDIWEFKTIASNPITEDPCGLTVNAGETAEFTVKAISGSTYLWKRLDESAIPNNTGATLTILNVQKINEDVYYCEVTSPTAFTADSAMVNLMTRRLVALWEFEDNFEDSEADGLWDGEYTDPNEDNGPPTAVFVLDPCSIDDGKAMQLSADPCHVQITDSADFFNFYPQGYTVNAWVKTEQGTTFGCIASKQYRAESWVDHEGWVLNCNSAGVAASGLRQVFDGSSVVGTSNIADNEWHMVTGTYNAETGTGSVYVDGELENQLVDTENKAPTNDQPVVLGAETVLAEVSPYEGLLDKTSIYSYALSPVEVALLYTDIMGGSLCVGGNPEYDLDGNCKVDILDFADFAADWLECNLVPDCIQ